MQIAVEVKLEQHRRSVRRPPGVGTTRLGETQRMQIQRRDEGIQKTHRVFSGDVILQPFRKQQRLGTVQTKTMVHA